MINDEDASSSHLLICKNLEKACEHLEEKFSKTRHLFFIREDFVLEDAKEVVKEAFIAESSQKTLILCAKNYNIYAQNSLLKILEEPPRNIVFILLAPVKTAFLPTIRSRLLLKELAFEKEVVSTGLNFSKLELGDAFNFIQEHSRCDKNDLKELIQAVIGEAILEHNISFTHEELEHFQKLLHLADLNTRAQTLLISLFLHILNRQNQ
ncbi:MAG: DNA polymerase III subunit delta' [Sulfurospirillaceae bacterium]|nr:DNA polymerase III subunit delta' [Sulfurospirillaceae bacterium]MDD3462924.1 DNA polymerase III subunit delta' [Sulfurospirillaceae bacterium]